MSTGIQTVATHIEIRTNQPRAFITGTVRVQDIYAQAEVHGRALTQKSRDYRPQRQ